MRKIQFWLMLHLSVNAFYLKKEYIVLHHSKQNLAFVRLTLFLSILKVIIA